MKKILVLSLLLLGIGSMALAQDQIVTQEQTAKDIKGAIVIKKQPTQECAKQTQKCEKIYGSIVILVQGKTPFDKTDNK